jgi:hypothetical protein
VAPGLLSLLRDRPGVDGRRPSIRHATAPLPRVARSRKLFRAVSTIVQRSVSRSSILAVGNRAACSGRAGARRSRSSSCSSDNLSRKPRWSMFSHARRAAAFADSAVIVDGFNALRWCSAVSVSRG